MITLCRQTFLLKKKCAFKRKMVRAIERVNLMKDNCELVIANI